MEAKAGAFAYIPRQRTVGVTLFGEEKLGTARPAEGSRSLVFSLRPKRIRARVRLGELKPPHLTTSNIP
jgi:hypothetical protein